MKKEETNENSNKENTNKENNRKKFIIIAIIIAILIVGGIFAYAKITEDKCTNTKSRSSEINAPMQPDEFKPVIYLYPTEEKKISVNLGYPNKITCSYPQYTNGWNVLAKPNGDLVDLDTERNLYSLYYENENTVKFDVKDDGFVVKGEDVAEFLEEKLAILGLTEREAEEFIIYWLPKLQENKYNYIRFATQEEIDANMPLYFSEEPDSLIRVLMTYKGLDDEIKVQEQKLETPKRTGFVVVEWGGTEIK